MRPMKRCPFCAQFVQTDAHHCQHCNSMIKDMDGNILGVKQAQRIKEKEWLDLVMKGCVTIFFTVQFFIDGIIILRVFLGISLLDLNSWATIIANIFLLLMSITGAMFITPPIIRWAKSNFVRVPK